MEIMFCKEANRLKEMHRTDMHPIFYLILFIFIYVFFFLKKKKSAK